MASADTEDAATLLQQLRDLRAQNDMLRAALRGLIAAIPAHPIRGKPLREAMRRFVEDGERFDPATQAARDRAFEWFGYQQIHRTIDPNH